MTAARARVVAWPVLLAATVALAACGQRGDLYLPTPQKSAVPAVSTACTQPADTGATTPASGCTKD